MHTSQLWLRFNILFFLCFIFLFCKSSIQAATCTWTGGNGNWNNASNWDCGVVPDSDDDVIINSFITVTLDIATTVSSLQLSAGGDLVLNFNLTISGDLTLSSPSSEISGTGDLNVDGNLNWSYGIISGSGAFTLDGTLTFPNNAQATLDTRSVSLSMGGSWTNTYVTMKGGATITIPSGQTLTYNHTVVQIRSVTGSNGGGTIVNNGTFEMTGTGTGTWKWTTITLDNNATFNISGSGVLDMDASTVSTHDNATVDIASSAELELGGTSHDFTSTSITGSGRIDIDGSGASINMNAGSTFSGNHLLESNSGTLTLNVATTFDSLYNSGNSSLVLNDNLTITNGARFGGFTVSGTGDLIINGNLDWVYGTVGGSGAFTLGGILTGSGNFGATLDTRSLSLSMGGTWTDYTFTLANSATITIPSGQTLSYIHNTAQPRFLSAPNGGGTIVNNGTLEKIGTSSAPWDWSTITLDNNATLNVNSGVLEMDASTVSTHDNATVDIASGAELRMGGTSHDFNTCLITGSGALDFFSTGNNVNINSGTTFSGNNILEITSGATVNLNVAATFDSLYNSGVSNLVLNDNLTITNGARFGGFTVSGTGDLIINGNLDWSSGTVGGSGGFTLGGTLTGSGNFGATLDTRNLTLSMGGTWTDYTFTMANNAIITIPSGQTLSYVYNAGALRTLKGTGGGGTIVNNGTLEKNGTSSTHWTWTDVTLDNNGTLAVNTGTLEFDNNANSTHDNANVIIASGAELVLDNTSTHTFSQVTVINGPGTLCITGGTVVINSPTTIQNNLDLKISGGTLEINVPVTFNSVTQSGGSITGTSNYTVTCDVNMSAGSIARTSPTTINIGCNLNLSGTTTISNVSVIPATGGTWTNANITMNDGATVTVPASQTLTIDNSATRTITDGGTGTNKIVNNGIIEKSTGAGIFNVKVDFENATGSELTVLDGTMKFEGDLDNQGRIEGISTIDVTSANVTKWGVVAPGTSIGTMEVKGTYENDCLEMEIGGTGGGVETDLLEVTQNAVIGGELNLQYIGGTIPPGSYDLITCSGGPGCRTGTFVTVNFPSQCSGCTIVYNSESVVLENSGAIQFSGQCNWNGGNGNWSDQNNWDCNDVPNGDDTVSISANQIIIDEPTSVSVLNISGGDLSGTGNLSILDDFNWTNGAFSLAGTHTFGKVNWSGGLSISDCNATIDKGGNWSNVNLTFSNTTVLNLASGQTLALDITSSSNIGNSGGTFNNNGTLVKTGNAPFTINTPFNSSGITDIGQGTLIFTNSFNNTNGTVIGTGIINLINATVQGFGIFAPGNSPGTLTVDGDYSNHILNVEIEESGGTVSNDLLVVTDVATLGGTLDIAHLSGTIPFGDYPLVQCNGGGACLSGSFTTVNYPSFCMGDCSIVYTNDAATFSYASPLAIELGSFRGVSRLDGIHLSWTTLTETENRGFEIERSREGIDWEKLGWVDGAGTSFQKLNYAFIDKRPMDGINFYRLKNIGFDNIYDYSAIITVEPLGQQKWKIYPNPVKDILEIQFSDQSEGTLTLVDWTGKTVLTQQLTDKVHTLNLEGLPQGMYWLKLEDGTGQVVIKN